MSRKIPTHTHANLIERATDRGWNDAVDSAIRAIFAMAQNSTRTLCAADCIAAVESVRKTPVAIVPEVTGSVG